eukprot:Mycagemm_TRINITY_DN10273_c0_g3::TRINITY_DN10273_c0_g3_i1::g.4185::m.4185 type:complete len:144 gc:universal TRINITY_DN10273_c0_g3_i1:29-460(+)
MGVDHPVVKRHFLSFRQYRQAFFFAYPRSSDDTYQPHAAIFIFYCLHQQISLVGYLVACVTKHLHGSCSHVVILRFQYLFQKLLIHFVQAPAYPQSFQQMMFVTWVAFIQTSSPGSQFWQNFRCFQSSQLASGSVTCTVFRQF